MKQLVITVGYFALMALSAFVLAEPSGTLLSTPFDVSGDENCWVAPEWRV